MKSLKNQIISVLNKKNFVVRGKCDILGCYSWAFEFNIQDWYCSINKQGGEDF